jgi:hypothetical protein
VGVGQIVTITGHGDIPLPVGVPITVDGAAS